MAAVVTPVHCYVVGFLDTYSLSVSVCLPHSHTLTLSPSLSVYLFSLLYLLCLSIR